MSGKFPCYRRAPSKELVQLLKPGEFLSPLLDLNKREVQGLRLDVHFRPDDEVAVYCGRANVLRVRLNRSKESIRVTAHDTYSQQCQALFREWPIGDSGFGKALSVYFSSLQVNPIFTNGEGLVQLRWSKETRCWTTFDREARLDYETTNHRNICANCLEIYDARKELDDVINADGKTWAKPDRNGIPLKLDLLAYDREGKLVLIEVKPTLSDYYVPFQLLHYIWEWRRALQDNSHLLAELEALIEKRVELGLSASFGSITDHIRPVVAIGGKDGSKEVWRRYSKVVQVANGHLPPRVSPVETWRYGGREAGAPTLIGGQGRTGKHHKVGETGFREG